MTNQDESISLLYQVHLSRINLLKQLDSIGYDTQLFNNISFEELNAMISENDLNFQVKDKNDNTVQIIYNITKSLNQTIIYEYIEYINLGLLKKTDVIYIIVKDESKINDNILNVIRYIWEKYNYFIVIKSLKSLQINILEHVLVPKHIVIKDLDEIEKIKNKFNLSSVNEFPKIDRFDPVSLCICLKPGELCLIERSSRSSIISNYYRYCVNYTDN